MKKSELFDRIIDKVCEVCEVRRATMMSQSKIQAIVDAGILGVQYLRRTGMSFEEIALYVMRESAGDSELCPPMSEVRKKEKGYVNIFGIQLGSDAFEGLKDLLKNENDTRSEGQVQ